MKNIYLRISLFIISINTSFAQFHTTPTYTPRVDNSWIQSSVMNPQFRGSYTMMSQKHSYKIIFKDGRDTVVFTKIYADSPSYYILLSRSFFHKKDSNRVLKIYPSQTKNLIRLDKVFVKEYIGLATDSCWLFKEIKGNINAYTPSPENGTSDDFITYIQKGDSTALIKMDQQNLEGLVKDNEKALELAKKKEYVKAITQYNKISSNRN